MNKFADVWAGRPLVETNGPVLYTPGKTATSSDTPTVAAVETDRSFRSLARKPSPDNWIVAYGLVAATTHTISGKATT